MNNSRKSEKIFNHSSRRIVYTISHIKFIVLEDIMPIETTLNLTEERINMIKKSAMTMKLPVGAIMSLLINRVIGSKAAARTFARVRYQKRPDGGKWKRLHVSLRPDAYEGCVDLRKLLKLSVSYIISMALDEYIVEILDNISTDADNYTPPYFFISKNTDGIQYFLIIRGIPAQKHINNLLL
jgi:hypothetical protein